MPPAATKFKSGKISNPQIFILPQLEGHVMAGMNIQSKFVYFMTTQTLNIAFYTLYVSGTELQTDKQTDNPITRYMYLQWTF